MGGEILRMCQVNRLERRTYFGRDFENPEDHRLDSQAVEALEDADK